MVEEDNMEYNDSEHWSWQLVNSTGNATNSELSAADWLAGLSLIIYGTLGLCCYAFVLFSMWKLSQQMNSYIFLMSQAMADILAGFVYSIVPGIIILIPVLAPKDRDKAWIHFILDHIWFTMVNHHLLVSWTRLWAVYWPHWFRSLRRRSIVSICTAVWLYSMTLTVILQCLPYWVTFYYEPSVYGMTSDEFEKYAQEGGSTTYLVYHSIVLGTPLLLYILVVYKYVQLHRKVTPAHKKEINAIKNKKNNFISKTSNTNAKTRVRMELRIMFPSCINTIMFVIGQILITYQVVQGKWGAWFVMIAFTTNSTINALLVLIFSESIRKQIFRIFTKNESE